MSPLSLSLASLRDSCGLFCNRFSLSCVLRLVFGTGGGSITVVQNRLTALWFEVTPLNASIHVPLLVNQTPNYFTGAELGGGRSGSGKLCACANVLFAFLVSFCRARSWHLRLELH